MGLNETISRLQAQPKNEWEELFETSKFQKLTEGHWYLHLPSGGIRIQKMRNGGYQAYLKVGSFRVQAAPLTKVDQLNKLIDLVI